MKNGLKVQTSVKSGGDGLGGCQPQGQGWYCEDLNGQNPRMVYSEDDLWKYMTEFIYPFMPDFPIRP